MLTPAGAVRSPSGVTLNGAWTALGLGAIVQTLDGLCEAAPVRQGTAGTSATQGTHHSTDLSADCQGITALDTAGVWVLHLWIADAAQAGRQIRLQGMSPRFQRLIESVAARQAALTAAGAAQGSLQPRPDTARSLRAAALASTTELGNHVIAAVEEVTALVSFVGEISKSLLASVAHPKTIRWRPILFNIRSAGVEALPIVGLLAFLLGGVVGYQSAGTLRQYGASLFIADVVGLSMVREFGPLITAIIVAGRSGSAYAAQIGTMSVTEEIDAMRTLGIEPLPMLVLPKLVAMTIALPLLTLFADVLGVFGGMLMAHSELDVGYGEFLDRCTQAISATSFLTGIIKAPVFAAIITGIGCFQGLRTTGGADSVGRHTTRSVVQAIFCVVVADGLFSVAFSLLDL